ncbi:integrase, catalytic region [Dethiobacter alkaliphilus AHT 1]|uniref:Integrase, catalytic region n=1 Tax=Dethiobacter alkaliphilus AHT 1 TaxID=555088 RepID=C0GE90_DETAL|nr:integrase, catalytic region [Dethiobacter alkaliphilus AHT 1]
MNELDHDAAFSTMPAYKNRAVKECKLEPYKTYIHERMNEGCVNAVVLHDEIVDKGYRSKLTILIEFMRPH